jgi:DNA polymerase III sliding clamp (beta) subunit (PCNA family)
MAVFLPHIAASLAKAAAKDEGRYAMAGVRVLDPRDGTYRLEATDGRRLIVLRGYNVLDGGPEPPDDVIYDGIIPTQDWTEGFKMVPRGNAWKGKQALSVELAKDRFLLTAPGAQREGALLDGRFPDFSAVLPKRPAVMSVAVNPKLLIELLQAALAVLPAGELRVEIHFYDKKGDCPVGISCKTGEHGGVYFDGLIMPLA